MDAVERLKETLTLRAKHIALDLAQVRSQEIRTTRHERRERALGYLAEAITYAMEPKPTMQEAEELWSLFIELSQKPRMNEEAKTSFKRAATRLEYMIAAPVGHILGYEQCCACDEVYIGKSHQCTNERAKRRDAK